MENSKEKTLADFTSEEIAGFKANNGWYYNKLKNNGYDLYCEGSIKDRNDNHKVIGITTSSLKKAFEICQSPNFAYARYKDYGIAIYHLDSTSPTGVINAGGIDHEFMWMVDNLAKSGTISPTEKA